MIIVIDIETLGRRNDAAITQIGIVIADNSYNAVSEALIPIKPSEWHTCNRTFTGETILWWLEQNNSPSYSETEQYSYRQALNKLSKLINYAQSNEDEETLIYTKGTMDLFCLKNLYEYFDEDTPWKFWQPRDIRSIKETVWGWKTIKENSHNALEDAVNELEELKINLVKISKFPLVMECRLASQDLHSYNIKVIYPLNITQNEKKHTYSHLHIYNGSLLWY